MSISSGLTTAYGFARVGFGALATAAPERLGRTWIGDDVSNPGAGVILRALGFRDIALGLGLTGASMGGQTRGWLAVTMLSDLGDVAATVIGRNQLERKDVWTTAALAGSGALAAGLLLLVEGSDDRG